MNVWQSIFFGLIQGFTEFLPVSSSGHLLLVSALTGVECPLFMSVMLHVGTLFAVIIAYRKPLLQILRHPISDKRLLYLVIASIPTFIIAAAVKFFLPEGVDKYILPVGFALTAALLLLSSLNKNKFSVGEKGVLPLLITGVAQGMACFEKRRHHLHNEPVRHQTRGKRRIQLSFVHTRDFGRRGGRADRSLRHFRRDKLGQRFNRRRRGVFCRTACNRHSPKSVEKRRFQMVCALYARTLSFEPSCALSKRKLRPCLFLLIRSQAEKTRAFRQSSRS